MNCREMIKVFLKRGREESILRYHPWVFSGAIAEIKGHPAEGDIVAVHSSDGSFLAFGHYQIGTIAIRILGYGDEVLAPDFWERHISQAYAMRCSLGLASGSCTDTDCYRLVHGEGDSLPGLIIDYYGGVCVMQAHSVGMFRARARIAEALRAVYGEALHAVYDKSSGTVPFKAGLEPVDGYLYVKEGFSDKDFSVKEYGNSFYVNWHEGQKTGFFLDQRENRNLVGRYASGKKVLNLFCYTGGFSVYALKAGASKVVSVDSSRRAISLLDSNLVLNGLDDGRHLSVCDDAIDYLKSVPDGEFDMIIVDPPAFAKHRGAIRNALKAYQRLNAAAISKVAPGGMVFTFSCSQAIDKESFALAVFSAAADTGRNVRILDRMNQPADHAVNIYHPEGEYLKGLVLYVE